MFTLLMANIQGETLICVSNSDREGARTQLHLQDRGTVVHPLRYVLPSRACSGASPVTMAPGPPWRLCHAGRGQGWAFRACCLSCTESNGGLLF